MGGGNAVDAVKSSLQHGDEVKMKHDVMYVCMRDMQNNQKAKSNEKRFKSQKSPGPKVKPDGG